MRDKAKPVVVSIGDVGESVSAIKGRCRLTGTLNCDVKYSGKGLESHSFRISDCVPVSIARLEEFHKRACGAKVNTFISEDILSASWYLVQFDTLVSSWP